MRISDCSIVARSLTRLNEVMNTAGLCNPSAATMSSCTLITRPLVIYISPHEHQCYLLLGGSGGESEYRHVVKALFEHGQLAELGSKVVSPSTNAMRLVHIYARD